MIGTVCGLTWIATAGDWLLPRIFLDSVHADPRRIWQTGAIDLSLTAGALALLWLRRRSVLDLWLMVMCCTWLLELTMTTVLLNTRFSLGWYASRILHSPLQLSSCSYCFPRRRHSMQTSHGQ